MYIALVQEQIETFLKAWDDYRVEIIKTAFLPAEIPPNKKGNVKPKKFNSLKEVDRYFHVYIKPMIGRFFKRNPSIRRNHGEAKDIEIYNKYADHCPYLLKPYIIGELWPVPPRVYINGPITSKEDVLLLAEKNATIYYKKQANFVEEVINQWKNYQDLILALAEREEAVPAAPETKSEILKPLRLKLVRNGSMAYWGDQLIGIKGKHFSILCKLAQKPGETVVHQDLYSLIESDYHQDILLRQYITDIRKAFPPPYCDSGHPEGIIKTRRMEGYHLNLPPDWVEIV